MPPAGARHEFVCLRCISRHLRSPNGVRVARPSQTRPYSRPSIAPKPVLDLKHIVRNGDLYEQNCKDRNYPEQAKSIKRIKTLNQRRVELVESARQARETNNHRLERIKQLQNEKKANGTLPQDRETEIENAFKNAARFKEWHSELQQREREAEEELEELALALPNLSSTVTPVGSEPHQVKVHRATADALERGGKSHVDIGVQLDMLDFVSAGKTSGWGWYYLKNRAAIMEQALVQYALSLLAQRGWTIVSPPSIVYSHIAAACGFQPRDQHGEQQIYNLQQPEGDEKKPPLSLIGTSEISLAGMNANQDLDVKTVPLKTAAVSRCYRAEAGARGVDTKGLYRVHEFTKVEMFAWTAPDDVSEDNFGGMTKSPAEAVFDEMVEIQQEILRELGLSFQVLEMPTADLGASASRKIDIEAFFPSRRGTKSSGWGEVTSASICTDFQSRRLHTRLKLANGKSCWPYTVNGTAMAVPRVLAALLETCWDESTGTLSLPKVLQPWLQMYNPPGRT